jgi:hypothetical protein
VLSKRAAEFLARELRSSLWNPRKMAIRHSNLMARVGRGPETVQDPADVVQLNRRLPHIAFGLTLPQPGQFDSAVT